VSAPGSSSAKQAEAQKARDAAISAFALKKGVADLERQLEERKARAQAELEGLMEEKPLTPWIVAAGALIAANALWNFGLVSIAGIAVYAWALRHYFKHWTKERRIEAAKAASDLEVAAIEKTLRERREELDCAERNSAKALS